ncbi:MAG TPA: ABC transporter ATP-binding protein [Ornithinimicrobium sp.]|uniref:ABC transporter ATP-binding protein n=1 Tax=Ornithinimicrobium sp. TaxID=1977084 RepID=UPI002B47E4D6|nr:ABC transporter ATP-binding protein [Ornithinimicrobium sp.]HKJ11346.1 ABC transporter ATP-binding protein [Ornithinimicrobium sp.]
MNATQTAPPGVEVATGTTDTAIEVTSLVKCYDGQRVVDDVSFSVRPGEIFGLLGANGAGKTTTVECLQGLRRPDSGRLRVLGLDPLTQRAPLRAVVGSQLQEAALPDRLRVGEAIALFAAGAGGSGGRARPGRREVAALLRPWGLHRHRRSSFADLSGGQRQRLFIALALLHRPQVLFLDELTQGLDPAARRDVWDVIRDVREAGTTVVMVSHLADEVEELCDRAAVLREGRVVHTGTPQELTRRFGGPTRITFTPPPGLDPARLRHLPGVRTVARCPQDPGALAVVGDAAMTPAVCAATITDGRGPSDLHVTHPRLHQAMLTLIGATS